MKVVVTGLVIVIVVAIVAGVTVYFRRKQGQETAREKGWSMKGDLNAAQERVIISENTVAAKIFSGLVAPPGSFYQLGSEEMTILSSEHKRAIEEWLRTHNVKRRDLG